MGDTAGIVYIKVSKKQKKKQNKTIPTVSLLSFQFSVPSGLKKTSLSNVQRSSNLEACNQTKYHFVSFACSRRQDCV